LPGIPGRSGFVGPKGVLSKSFFKRAFLIYHLKIKVNLIIIKFNQIKSYLIKFSTHHILILHFTVLLTGERGDDGFPGIPGLPGNLQYKAI